MSSSSHRGPGSIDIKPFTRFANTVVMSPNGFEEELPFDIFMRELCAGVLLAEAEQSLLEVRGGIADGDASQQRGSDHRGRSPPNSSRRGLTMPWPEQRSAHRIASRSSSIGRTIRQSGREPHSLSPVMRDGYPTVAVLLEGCLDFGPVFFVHKIVE